MQLYLRYYGNIHIGHPEQIATVVFDTGQVCTGIRIARTFVIQFDEQDPMRQMPDNWCDCDVNEKARSHKPKFTYCKFTQESKHQLRHTDPASGQSWETCSWKVAAILWFPPHCVMTLPVWGAYFMSSKIVCQVFPGKRWEDVKLCRHFPLSCPACQAQAFRFVQVFFSSVAGLVRPCTGDAQEGYILNRRWAQNGADNSQ